MLVTARKERRAGLINVRLTRDYRNIRSVERHERDEELNLRAPKKYLSKILGVVIDVTITGTHRISIIFLKIPRAANKLVKIDIDGDNGATMKRGDTRAPKILEAR